MHILTTPQTYPYSVSQLRRDNPQTSFPRNPSDALLAQYNVFPVKLTDRPQFDPMTQRLEERSPEFKGSAWVQKWAIEDLSEQEQEQRLNQAIQSIKERRLQAFSEEADPLFFKWQAGEGPKSDWTTKREEIRTRFPYPDEGGQ